MRRSSIFWITRMTYPTSPYINPDFLRNIHHKICESWFQIKNICAYITEDKSYQLFLSYKGGFRTSIKQERIAVKDNQHPSYLQNKAVYLIFHFPLHIFFKSENAWFESVRERNLAQFTLRHVMHAWPLDTLRGND